MIRNVGSIDKTIRLVAGVALIAYGILGMNAAGLGLAAIAVGVVLLGTGLINFCPLFKLLGISSFKQQS